MGEGPCRGGVGRGPGVVGSDDVERVEPFEGVRQVYDCRGAVALAQPFLGVAAHAAEAADDLVDARRAGHAATSSPRPAAQRA